MLQHMKQILIDLDEVTARRLEQVAPARARKRSEFVRDAIRRSLDELAEHRMAEAYVRHPDDPWQAYLDPAAWEPPAARVRPRRSR